MRRTILLLTAAVAVSACSSTSTWTAPLPPDADPAVAAVMPKGTYTVSGGLTLGGKPVYELEGFVDFGTKPDGIKCESEHTITDVSAASTATKDGRQLVSRAVRAAGGPEWYADATGRDAESSEQNLEWRDITDQGAPTLPLLFTPSIVASDLSNGVFQGAGNGWLCSIGVMPRFMQLDGERLVFDVDRVEAIMAAGRGRWIEQFLTAAGVSGRQYDDVAEKFADLTEVSYSSLIKDAHLVILNSADGSFEIVQFKNDKPIVTLTFTPAEDRVVTAPEATTFFERIAAEAESNGTDSALREAGLID